MYVRRPHVTPLYLLESCTSTDDHARRLTEYESHICMYVSSLFLLSQPQAAIRKA